MSNSADDPIAELERLVGSGRGSVSKRVQAAREGTPIAETSSLSLTPAKDANAPRLEFDLEDELMRAFDGGAAPKPKPADRDPSFDMQSLEAALAMPTSAKPVEPAPAGIAPRPVLTEVPKVEVPAAEPKVEAPAAEPETTTPPPAMSSEPVPLDAFSKQLEALIEAADKPAAPKPVAPQVPQEQAEIVAPTTLPRVEEPAAEELAFDTFFDSTDSLFQPAPPPRPTPQPVEAAQPVAAAATATDVPGGDAQDALEAALARELDGDLDGAFGQETSHAEQPGKAPQVSAPVPLPRGGYEKRRFGRRVAAAIAGVAVLGGSAALALNLGSDEPAKPPQLLASKEPVKVKPKDAGGTAVPNQDQTVYRTVGGEKPAEPKQTALKDSGEKPLAVAKAKPKPVKPATQNASTRPPLVKPRLVRTVVVRPDGTIVNQFNTAESVPTRTISQQAQPAPRQVAAVAVPVTSELASIVKAPESKPEPTAPAVAPKADALKPAEPKEEAVASIAPKPVTTEPAKVEAKPEPRSDAPKAAETTKPKEPKSQERLPVAAKPATPSPYAVQISSQLSPEAAQKSWNTLSRRYASVIGDMQPDIRKKLVKGKTYFGVRVPAASKAEASKICGALKAKGGDCFVTR